MSPLPKSTNSKIKQKPKIIEMRALEQKFQFPVPPSKIVKENFASKIELGKTRKIIINFLKVKKNIIKK